MANKEFLETYPLYKKFFNLTEISRWTDVQGLSKPAIHMYCSACDSDQTFNMANEYHEVFRGNVSILETVLRLQYVCSACESGMRVFLIHFSETKKIVTNSATGKKEESDVLYVEKVGQTPAWDITMDKELESLLGEHADGYRKGLVCESQSYGVGAYAYYRRVTENVIDQLLASIADILPAANAAEYAIKLGKVKTERITEKKINLVEDLLPESLKADGMNPLKELHKILSEGIHNMTDEECMDKAEAIRSILVYLVNQVAKTKNDKKSFTEGMSKILGRKIKS
ncbi:MAG: hypothetical protein ACYCZZ_01145 [Minisyncoccota bacterium]